MDKIFFIGYGLVLLIGAFFGWKAGSKISLISGSISGLLILLGVYLINVNTKGGYGLLSAISGLLAITFVIRFIKTHQVIPSGALFMLSLISFIFAASLLIQK